MKRERVVVQDSIRCKHCGIEGCMEPRKLDIAIEKGHVRRASLAANSVFSAARGQFGTEPGVVFMTAILLIERLAKGYNCDPSSILHKAACCFEVKERHARASDQRN